MNTTKYNFNGMNEDDKILVMIDLLGAVSKDTAVTMEQIIAKGIETGATEDYFRENWHGYKNGDHPWWQKITPMVGVGTENEVANHDVPGLHRHQVKEMKGDRQTNVMRYWFDETHRHEVVIRKKTPKNSVSEIKGNEIRFRGEAAEKKAQENPEYIALNGKVYSRKFILGHPEKFTAVEIAMAKY